MKNIKELLLILLPAVIIIGTMAATRHDYMEAMQAVDGNPSYDIIRPKQPEAYTYIEEEEPDSFTLPSAGVALTDLVYRKPADTGIQLDDGEVNDLLQIAAAEAGTEDATGQALVMCVVLNRVKNREFPDYIRGVITQSRKGIYQFTMFENGKFWDAQPTQDTYDALEMVQSGWDESCGATYFCTHKAAGKWHEANLDYIFQYGKHRFYREKGASE